MTEETNFYFAHKTGTLHSAIATPWAALQKTEEKTENGNIIMEKLIIPTISLIVIALEILFSNAPSFLLPAGWLAGPCEIAVRGRADTGEPRAKKSCPGSRQRGREQTEVLAEVARGRAAASDPRTGTGRLEQDARKQLPFMFRTSDHLATNKKTVVRKMGIKISCTLTMFIFLKNIASKSFKLTKPLAFV